MDAGRQGIQAWSKIVRKSYSFVIVWVGCAKNDSIRTGKITESRQGIGDRGQWAEGQPKLMSFSLVYSSVRSTMLVDAFLLHVILPTFE
jgi:hypothetical protein